MQTFLPYPDFVKTANCLDWRRLGKQRVEALQILNILRGYRKTGGWVNHPAVKMWQGYDDALAYYMNCCIVEWKNRGYKNNLLFNKIPNKFNYPFWLGDEIFHSAHRQTLLYKDFEWYSQFYWKEQPKYEYFWPVK